MKLKELTLAAVLTAALIAQNYLLYSFPITLTYLFLYLIARNTKSISIIFATAFSFVAIKNLNYPAFPTVMVADFLMLFIIMLISKIKINILRYFLIPIFIFIHILALDFATVLMIEFSWELYAAKILMGSITYIYAPASIILIIYFDGVEIIQNLKEKN